MKIFLIVGLTRIFSLCASLATVYLASIHLTVDERGLMLSAIAITSATGLFDLGMSIGGVRAIAEKNSINDTFAIDAALTNRKLLFFKRYLNLKPTFLFILKWYAVVGLVFFILSFLLGDFFDLITLNHPAIWYMSAISLTALTYTLLPFTILMEGLGRMAFVYGLRAFGDVVFVIALGVALFLKNGLMSLAIAQGAKFVTLGIVHGIFNAQIVKDTISELLYKKTTPISVFSGAQADFQRRLMIISFVGFCTAQIVTPSLNATAGSAIAGSYGSVAALVAALNSAGLLHATLNFSKNTYYFSRNEHSQLLGMMYASLTLAGVIFAAGTWFYLLFTAEIKEFLFNNMLLISDNEIILIFVAGAIQMYISIFASYFRAMGKERFLLLNSIFAVLNLFAIVILVKENYVRDFLLFQLTSFLCICFFYLIAAIKYFMDIRLINKI